MEPDSGAAQAERAQAMDGAVGGARARWHRSLARPSRGQPWKTFEYGNASEVLHLGQGVDGTLHRHDGIAAAVHLRALHLAALGRWSEGLAAIAQAMGAMTPGFSRGWRRTYLHVQARIHWRAEDGDGLAALLPDLAGPRSAREWPVLDTGAALVQGQHALLRGDLMAARALLERATALQRSGRLPVFMGDARVALAACRAEQGEDDGAAATLDEVLAETVVEDSLGLLLEPPARLEALWNALAPKLCCPMPAQDRLRRRLAGWRNEPGLTEALPQDGPLSAREREVLALLAEGQSNKLIARALGLSVHTVKRHVANILTKLALDSRTQAAAYWHRR